MRLGLFRHPSRPLPFTGLVLDSLTVDVSHALTTPGDVFDLDAHARAALVTSAQTEAEQQSQSVVPLSEVTYLPPVPRPGKIIAVGLNYRDHAAE